jgi:hypothetical protein
MVKAGYDLYRNLRARAPQLLSAHITDDKTRSYYDTVQNLVESGYSEAQAFVSAHQAVYDPSVSETPKAKEAIKKLREDFAAGVSVPGSGFLGMGSETVQNGGYAARKVEEYAKAMIVSGGDPERAIKLARDRFFSTHMIINGYAVEKAANTPAWFEQRAEDAIKRYVADFGDEEGYAENDLTIRPAGKGDKTFYMIVRKSDGAPVKHGWNLTYDQLAESERKRVEGVRQGEIDKTNNKPKTPGQEARDMREEERRRAAERQRQLREQAEAGRNTNR